MQCLQFHTLRSFTVFLAIILVTISPASGFTIRKIENFATTSDLDAEESSMLEVKYDLQTPKHDVANKTDQTVAALNESESAPIATYVTVDSHIPSATNKSESQIVNTIKEDQNVTTPITLQLNANESTTIATTLLIKEETTNFILPTTVSILNERTDETTTEPTSERSDFTNTLNSTIVQNGTNSYVTSTYNDDTTPQDSTTEYTSTSPSDDSNTLKSIDSFPTTHELKEATTEIDGTVPNLTSNNSYDFTTNTDLSLTTLQPSAANEESFKVTIIDFVPDTNDGYLENNPPTTTKVPMVETLNTEPSKLESVTLMQPTLNTYETINEMATTTTGSKDELVTSSDLKLTRSESGRMTLEEVLTNTPITSLVQLKNDLLNSQVYTTKAYATEINVTSVPKIENITTKNIGEQVKLQTEKIEIVSSKRAGYLDNTGTTSMRLEEATTVDYVSKDNASYADTFGSMYETEGGEGDASDTLEAKNTTGIESQSQLVEDAIKEELLMEKTLHEHEYVKKKTNLMTAKSTLEVNPPTKDVTPFLHEVVTEDILSVKPITTKKNQLYSVSPSYKPLKKLDIQPTKQIVRDPDDNSWRNESISSLGIVFKPKNASKSFTEVLKNKTTELSNMTDGKNKNDIPDLRVRLGKIAEVRKSRKKKINISGDVVYSDYEDSSVDNGNLSKEEISSPLSPQEKSNFISVTSLPHTMPTTETDAMVNYIQKETFKMFKEEFSTHPSTLKNKFFRAGDYDTSEDYDADDVTKIDLKKFTPTPKAETFTPSRQNSFIYTKQPYPTTHMTNRQPTVQYFPPTKKVKTTVSSLLNQKVNIDDYDDGFKNKVNQFAYTQPSISGYEVSFGTASPAQTHQFGHRGQQTLEPPSTPAYNNENMHKNLYLTSSSPRGDDMQGGFLKNSGNINKASYVIKHYKDFIADAGEGSGDDNLSFTVAPIQSIPVRDIDKIAIPKGLKRDEDYDYNTHFHKEIVSRFVDNFNQNSDRFKVDFPIVYNNSVVHRMVDDKGQVIASSRTLMKRLYNAASPRPNFLSNVKPCDANCESMRVVDLLPAYELHYYVPDQEEKEEVEPRPNVLPYRYRL